MFHHSPFELSLRTGYTPLNGSKREKHKRCKGVVHASGNYTNQKDSSERTSRKNGVDSDVQQSSECLGKNHDQLSSSLDKSKTSNDFDLNPVDSKKKHSHANKSQNENSSNCACVSNKSPSVESIGESCSCRSENSENSTHVSTSHRLHLKSTQASHAKTSHMRQFEDDFPNSLRSSLRRGKDMAGKVDQSRKKERAQNGVRSSSKLRKLKRKQALQTLLNDGVFEMLKSRSELRLDKIDYEEATKSPTENIYGYGRSVVEVDEDNGRSDLVKLFTGERKSDTNAEKSNTNGLNLKRNLCGRSDHFNEHYNTPRSKTEELNGEENIHAVNLEQQMQAKIAAQVSGKDNVEVVIENDVNNLFSTTEQTNETTVPVLNVTNTENNRSDAKVVNTTPKFEQRRLNPTRQSNAKKFARNVGGTLNHATPPRNAVQPKNCDNTKNVKLSQDSRGFRNSTRRKKSNLRHLPAASVVTYDELVEMANSRKCWGQRVRNDNLKDIQDLLERCKVEGEIDKVRESFFVTVFT